MGSYEVYYCWIIYQNLQSWSRRKIRIWYGFLRETCEEYCNVRTLWGYGKIHQWTSENSCRWGAWIKIWNHSIYRWNNHPNYMRCCCHVGTWDGRKWKYSYSGSNGDLSSPRISYRNEMNWTITPKTFTAIPRNAMKEKMIQWDWINRNSRATNKYQEKYSILWKGW